MFGLSWPELHGALTHFPVALLITAAVFEIGAGILRKPVGRLISFWLLIVAVVMAVPTLITGWITGNELFSAGRAPSLFVWHRAAAFTTAGLAILLLLWRWRAHGQLVGGALALSAFLILIIAGVVGYTGYLGGKMVFNTPSTAHTEAGHEHAGDEPQHEAGGHEAGHEAGHEGAKPSVNPHEVARGEQLFKSNNCLSCHKMNGKGGTMGPDLTLEGAHHADIRWHIAHLKQPDKMTPGSAMPSFAHLNPDDLKALAAYLVSRR